MPEQSNANALEKVYAEAGQWLRMCNSIVWTMGALFVPLSAACVGLALRTPAARHYFGGASVFVFGMWVYMSWLYRRTTADARQVLMNIEGAWGVPKEMALYQLHGQVGHRIFSLYRMQILALVLLVILWIVLIFVVPPGLTLR